MDVSLPPAQERFVRSLVRSGRYQSASEVVSDGLQLLEQAEHRRLLEKWLHEGLSEEEEAALPAGLLDWAKERVRDFVEQPRREIREGGGLDGPETVRRIRAEIEARRLRDSA